MCAVYVTYIRTHVSITCLRFVYVYFHCYASSVRDGFIPFFFFHENGAKLEIRKKSSGCDETENRARMMGSFEQNKKIVMWRLPFFQTKISFIYEEIDKLFTLTNASLLLLENMKINQIFLWKYSRISDAEVKLCRCKSNNNKISTFFFHIIFFFFILCSVKLITCRKEFDGIHQFVSTTLTKTEK